MLSPVKLIREEFPDATLEELKQLSKADRVELASAIARNRGIPRESCDFEPVEY